MQVKTASFVGAVAMLAAVSYASDSEAMWIRSHAASCFVAMPFGTGQPAPSWMNIGDGVGNVTTAGQELMCAVPDNSTLQRWQYKTVNVETWVETASNAISAQLCEDQWNGAGGSCTQSVNSAGVQHQALPLGGLVGTMNTWTSSGEANFGYVDVFVAGATGGLNNVNSIRGIFYSN